MSAALHPDFHQALHAEIRDPDIGAFVQGLEQLVRRAVERQEVWSIGSPELKLLVRHRCRRYDEVTEGETFGDGSYFPFFTGIYASTVAERQLLLQALEALYELSEGLDDPVSAAAATSSRVIRTWSQLARRDTPLDPTPATQLMLWRVFESIVKGEIEVVEIRWGDRVRHYPRFATAESLKQRRADPRRAEVLSNLKYHIELIALADYDRLEVFSDLIVDFVTHLRGDVLAVGRAPDNAAMIAYLRVLQDRYLPGLFNYARILRKASQGSPFLGDLLHESYLVRTRSFDGDQEPSFARLLQDWTVAQRVIQIRAGYRSTKGFSFAQAYLEEAAPTGAGHGGRGQTQPGFPVKELGDFETFIELPRQGAGAEAAPAGFSGDCDVDDSAETTPYQRVQSAELRTAASPPESQAGLPAISGPPPSGPRVLPVRLGSMDNLYSAPTEILPVLTDDAVDLHIAVTEILPTMPDGSVDLERVATQLFPTLPGSGHGEDG
jgi:hypothetical protein